jgi:hypothetical protein
MIDPNERLRLRREAWSSQVFTPGQAVTAEIDGRRIGQVAVDDVLG